MIIVLLGINAIRIKRGKSYLFITQMFVAAISFFLINTLLNSGNLSLAGILWTYPTIISFYFMLPEKQAWLANILLLSFTIPIASLHLDNYLLIRIAATLITVSAFSAIFIRIISKHQEAIEELAIRDPLTGLLNRLTLQVILEKSIEQHRRSQRPIALLAIDLDYFKRVNDKFGHDVGDKVLVRIAEFFQNRMREQDYIFRFGGEEFLILLPGTDRQGGIRLAEEMRSSVEKLEVLENYSMSISIGISLLSKDDDWSSWIKRADKNLYKAKEKGRNRIQY